MTVQTQTNYPDPFLAELLTRAGVFKRTGS
jgi:hypothetical protein